MGPDQYASNRGGGEWETDYPNWEILYKAVDQIIDSLNLGYNEEVAELLIQILAIDNESETTLEKIESSLVPTQRQIYKRCCKI
ncbi:hypothetical protein SAMN05421823_1045 [Catalinimonas alkaloidigena]|uniref:Uncharacterized protein n=2 Tax=Catalinimonas alkaloidigena TaxID=1075417 RepID=A0A1G9G736_9BACT|nr:hypothetical protein SAMN05421823_1045 [Catalinimonas alkaloidigena]